MKGVGRYKAIIFDLDGTLIDSMPYHVKAFEKLYTVRGIKLNHKETQKLMGLHASKIIKMLNAKYEIKEDVLKMREERRKYFFEILGRKNIIFPGVSNTIKKLRKEYKTAIVTGSSRKSYNYSTNIKFKKLFDCIICVDEVKRAKPAPDELLAAAKILGVKPSECLMVGDSVFDHIAAKRAKINSVGVLTGYTSKKDLLKAGAKEVLNSVNELDKVI